VSARDPFREFTIAQRVKDVPVGSSAMSRAVEAFVEMEEAARRAAALFPAVVVQNDGRYELPLEEEDEDIDEMKIGYITVRGIESKAYVSSPDAYGFATGTNKYTDENIKVWWDGHRWVEVESLESGTE
jgi:hypothetical protein